MTTTILVGDVLERLRELADGSVHCVVTSPPYWAKRDYGVQGQIGLEPTPQEYIVKMVKVFRAIRRVLRNDGTAWVNMGDGYDAGTCKNRCPSKSAGKHGYWTNPLIDKRATTPLGAKQLIGMPWRLAFALQADGWYLRSDIIWHKPNPMPESCTDRPTKAHEYVFLLSKSARYFYDEEAVREATSDSDTHSKGAAPHKMPKTVEMGAGIKNNGSFSAATWGRVLGRNLRTVWKISTEAYRGAHFATYPRKLVAPCIKAGTSNKGCCAACGTPWVRVIEKERVRTRPGRDSKSYDRTTGDDIDEGVEKPWRDRKEIGNRDPGRHITQSSTVGWRPQCECGGEPVPCVVLDPFCGSGTTGVVAKQLGCDFIGIELNPDYAAMAERRIADPEPEADVPDLEGQLRMEFAS